MDGVILINKQKGYTSNDVVQKVRKVLNTKKVGHAGTLDPLATGVLPILVGKGTKLSKYLMEHDKTYIATITLGEKKSTGDLEGETIMVKEVKSITKQMIEQTLATFLGKQNQLPPMYSAIKKDGKKLYEYAREGIEVERSPRQIEIYKIKLLEYEENTITFEVSCSKGTYIRTLCEDIAEKLGTVGYMSYLNRVQVNKFRMEHAVTLKQLEENTNVQENIITIEEIFKEKECIILDNTKLPLFLNGVLLTYQKQDGIYRIKNEQGEFIGLGVINDGKIKRDIIL